ncbi:transposase [Neisseria meningitidis LNP27256]|nr:transposase [Neisseria meningitidis LNP27256]
MRTHRCLFRRHFYSGLNLNQDKATKPQTVQIVRQGEATPYWFLLILYNAPFGVADI